MDHREPIAATAGHVSASTNSVEGATRARQPLRSPHLAELVAGTLRKRILAGDLKDGDELPRQADLAVEFGVSKPSARDALRILEAEGLVSVRRGKVGGAVVHLPQPDNVAYSLSLVLRSRAISPDDTTLALSHLEPLCAALCAARPDRSHTAVPRLRAAHEAAVGAVDDFLAYGRATRLFHEELVACCGNETLIIVAGAIETVWSHYAAAWAARSVALDATPDLEYRQRGLDDHKAMLDLIVTGDAEGVARLARAHLNWVPDYHDDHPNGPSPNDTRTEPVGPVPSRRPTAAARNYQAAPNGQ